MSPYISRATVEITSPPAIKETVYAELSEAKRKKRKWMRRGRRDERKN
jgi:rRNA-processing protein FCF1